MLVLHAGAIGDCVLTSHLVASIHRGNPNSNITLAARSQIAHWFAEKTNLFSACDIESLQLHRFYGGDEPVDAPTAVDTADLIVNLISGPESRLTKNLQSTTGAKIASADPTARPETIESRRHITDQWVQDLRRQGLLIEQCSTQTALYQIDEELKSHNQEPAAIIHPGAGGKSKCAPIENFEEIASRLQDRGVNVSWMIGPTERDWFGQPFFDRLSQTAPVIEQHDIRQAADQLTRAQMSIGNDAGMSHVAAAIGLKTAVLFGPTESAIWKPLGPSVRSFRFPLNQTTGDARVIADWLLDTLPFSHASAPREQMR